MTIDDTPAHAHEAEADSHHTQDMYATRGRVWSGNVNAPLAAFAKDLTPGSALDLGCGEGADALWLAGHGWHVTAVDNSPIAISRAKELVAETSHAGMIVFRELDLSSEPLQGSFDLVSAHYLHAGPDFPRDAVLRNAATAVAPGGHLMVVGHAEVPPWSHHREMAFPTAEATFRSLALPDDGWRVHTIGEIERQTISPKGEPATIKDSVVIVRRAR